MKKLYTLFSALVTLSIVSFAQTLTQVNNAPQIGVGITYNSASASFVNTPTSGTGVNWNYSTLDSIAQVSYSYVNTSSVAFSSDFPGSNMVKVDAALTEYIFLNVTATSVEVTGVAYNSGALVKMPYSNTGKIMQYDFNYGNSFTDDIYGSFSQVVIIPITNTRTGSVTVEMIGTGTLTLPKEVISNVMLVKIQQSLNDVSTISTPVASNSTYYHWYTSSSRYPVLAIETSSTPLETPARVYYKQATPTEISNTDFSLASVTVYPNPSESTITIENATLTGYSIYNLLGECVLKGEAQNNTISIEMLPKGMYLLKANTLKGNYTAKISKI